MSQRPLIVIGPTPPPFHGVALVTVDVLAAARRCERLAAHLNTSDPRPVTTTGDLDLVNVWLGLKHAAQLAVLLARRREADVYLPLSQGRWGFVRDAAFIWLSRLARRRVIVHLNGGHFRRFYEVAPALEQRLIRSTLRGVDRAWVVTPGHLEIFGGLVPGDRVRMLENAGEDMRAMAPPSEKEPDAGLRILYLSNLVPEKGCFDLLDALARIGGAGGPIEVRLVGEADPEVAEEIERRAVSLAQVGVHVELVGVRVDAEKAREFAWADVFAYPSRYPPEGQPLVLLEAMSAGLPIVSTDHSGIPHTVRDEREGLIVPPGDIDAIASAIERLAGDRELRERLGAAARDRYESAYTPARFHRAVEVLISES
jgi:glycosyltransferase involved in cell wall biosynthesis